MSWMDDAVPIGDPAKSSWMNDAVPVGQESNWSDLPKNIIPDAESVVKGLGELVKGPALDIMSGDIASALPKFAKMNPTQEAEGLVKPFENVVSKEGWIQHPVQNTLMAGSLLAPALTPESEATDAILDAAKNKGANMGADLADLSSDTIKRIKPEMTGSPEAVRTVQGQANPADIRTQTGARLVNDKVVGGFGEDQGDIWQKEAIGKAKEVKDYVSRGYEGFAKKPGAIADVADYIQGKSQMAAAQQMGATPLQARQIGHEGMRATGQYALDNGIVGPTVGLRGMRLRNTELLDNAGKTLGDLRKQADSVRNPLETPVDTLQAVRQKLDPEYMSGTRTGSAEYQMALKNIENSDPSFEGMAKTATKLNKLANEANRLNQPHGPYTDVANEMSGINNERIKQLLGPQKAAQYEQALKEYGVNKKISEFLKRKEAGEVKRLGPGSLTSNLTQKIMDEIGYKTAAKVGNKVSTSILKNPSIAKSLPSLFKEFTHQIEDVGQEVTGMYKGGVVPKDVGAYVQTRNQKSGSRNESNLAEARRG